MKRIGEIMFFCKFTEKNLRSFADSKVGGVKNLIIREHLDSCSSCRAKYESIADTKLTPHPNLKEMKKQVKAQEHKAQTSERKHREQ